MNKNKDQALTWWMSPRCEHGQWWWGYQKVRMIKRPDLKKEFLDRNKEK